MFYWPASIVFAGGGIFSPGCGKVSNMSDIILKSNNLVIAEDRRHKALTEFYYSQTECIFCRGELDIYTRENDDGSIKEEARCSQCKALNREENHKIH